MDEVEIWQTLHGERNGKAPNQAEAVVVSSFSRQAPDALSELWQVSLDMDDSVHRHR
jgi:hypothetical protein